MLRGPVADACNTTTTRWYLRATVNKVDRAIVDRLCGQTAAAIKVGPSPVDEQGIVRHGSVDVEVSFDAGARLKVVDWRALIPGLTGPVASALHRDAIGSRLVDAPGTLWRAIHHRKVLSVTGTDFGDLEVAFEGGTRLQAMALTGKYEEWELVLDESVPIPRAVLSNYVFVPESGWPLGYVEPGWVWLPD